MTDIWVKNNHIEQKNWCGQGIDPGEYYLIEAFEVSRWQTNSVFLVDLANGVAVLAKSDSGSDDIIDVAKALAFLNDKPPTDENGIPVVAPTFEDTQGLTVVWKGRLHTAIAGSLNIFDHPVITQIKVRGGWYELMDGNAAIGDYIEFSIIDKDNILGLFSAYGLTEGVDILELKKFIRTEYVNPKISARQDFSADGASTVIAGLYMRVSYLSTGVDDVQFKVMEKYHEL